MDILATLHDELDNLSRSEKRISDLLFQDTEFAINASIADLAERANVSPPTVSRFCRRLGCHSYSEFKVRLAQTTYVGARYLKNTEQHVLEARELVDDVIAKAQMALHAFQSSLDINTIDLVAEKICRANMVYAFGSGGNSSHVAKELQNRLFRLGVRVTASSDHTMQLMMASSAKTDDLIIASSISGRNEELINALQSASDYKVSTIALTRDKSPLAKIAEIVLPIDIAEGENILRPTSVRYAFMAQIDILATLVAIKLGKSAVETLRRIKHQMVSIRDEGDRDALGD